MQTTSHLRFVIVPALVAFVAANTSACGGDPESLTHTSTQSVLAGTRSDDSAVVAVINPNELCSGYLIAPNLVVTARHCVGAIDGGTRCEATSTQPAATSGMQFAASDIGVSTATTVNETSPLLTVAEVIVIPDSDTAPVCGNDIALLRLATPIANAHLVEPRLDLRPFAGEHFTAIGYGVTGSNPYSSGTRRASEGHLVDAVGRTTASGVARTLDGEWIADSGPCGGDSGSPALDSEGRAIGVMSRGNPSMCVSMVYERLDPHAAWLRAATIAACATASLQPPAWTADPANGIVSDGEACRGDSECSAPSTCLPTADGSSFVCTRADCSMCSAGWTCGTFGDLEACITPPAPDDASSTDASADDATADAATMPMQHAGCAIARPSSPRASLALIALAFAASLARRRTRRDRRRSLH